MTPREADKLIKLQTPVVLRNMRYDETFTVVLVKRDKFTVTTSTGSVFERDELQLIKQEN